MARVFVVQEPLRRNRNGDVVPKMDLSPAMKFGELVYLLRWGDARLMDPRRLVCKLREGLRDYSDRDYLLMTGSPNAMWIAGVIASKHTNGVVNVLEWEAVEKHYRLVEVDIGAFGQLSLGELDCE